MGGFGSFCEVNLPIGNAVVVRGLSVHATELFVSVWERIGERGMPHLDLVHCVRQAILCPVQLDYISVGVNRLAAQRR